MKRDPIRKLSHQKIKGEAIGVNEHKTQDCRRGKQQKKKSGLIQLPVLVRGWRLTYRMAGEIWIEEVKNTGWKNNFHESLKRQVIPPIKNRKHSAGSGTIQRKGVETKFSGVRLAGIDGDFFGMLGIGGRKRPGLP